jgi:hypothetical protein
VNLGPDSALYGRLHLSGCGDIRGAVEALEHDNLIDKLLSGFCTFEIRGKFG